MSRSCKAVEVCESSFTNVDVLMEGDLGARKNRVG